MATTTRWRAAANVLVVASDEPRPWLEGERQLRDLLGDVTDEDEASLISHVIDR